MILVNPNTGKPVDVSDKALVDRFLAAGFTEQEPAKKPSPARKKSEKK